MTYSSSVFFSEGVIVSEYISTGWFKDFVLSVFRMGGITFSRSEVLSQAEKSLASAVAFTISDFR
jgi:hypothetical protein